MQQFHPQHEAVPTPLTEAFYPLYIEATWLIEVPVTVNVELGNNDVIYSFCSTVYSGLLFSYLGVFLLT